MHDQKAVSELRNRVADALAEADRLGLSDVGIALDTALIGLGRRLLTARPFDTGQDALHPH